MSLEKNKSIVRRWIEAYNKRNLDVFDEFIASDYVDHSNKVDRDGLKQLFNMGFKAFPDWHETIEDIIAEGDKVWIAGPLQAPGMIEPTISARLDIPVENIEIEMTRMGGGFGRRSASPGAP